MGLILGKTGDNVGKGVGKGVEKNENSSVYL